MKTPHVDTHFAFAILILVASLVGFVFWLDYESEKIQTNNLPSPTISSIITPATDPSTSEIGTYFYEGLRDAMAEEGVVPKEGFRPSLIMSFFPGILPQDFEKVAAGQGMYQVTNDELIFVANTESLHTAAEAITLAGFDVLLENITKRKNISLKSLEDIHWQLIALRFGKDRNLREAFLTHIQEFNPSSLDFYDTPDLAFRVLQEDRGHIEGMALPKDPTGGGSLPSFLAIKSDASWKVIYNGQDLPECSIVNQYNFPTSIAPKCLKIDSDTFTEVQR